jgi:hypothetical protein
MKASACFEVPGLGAGLTMVQDPGDVKALDINVTSDDGKSALVRARYTSYGKTKDAVVELRKFNNAWKVHDICPFGETDKSKCYRAEVMNSKCK